MRLRERAPGAERAFAVIFGQVGTAEGRAAQASQARQALRDVPPEVLVGELARLRLEGLVGARLLEVAGDDAGEELRTTLTDAVRRQDALGEAHELLALAVVGALEAAGVAALPLKGALLGRRLHGRPGARRSADIDVLIDPDQRDAAAAVLRDFGWTLLEPPLGELPDLHWTFLHPGGSPPVELHWRVHWYEDVFAQAALRRSTEPGAQGRTLAGVDELAFLLLFYARDGFTGLRQVADVAAWHDAAGPDAHLGLAGIVDEHPQLAPALVTAAHVAHAMTGSPLDPSLERHVLPRRAAFARELSNSRALGSLRQRHHDWILIDGLLTPPGQLDEYVGRHLLPSLDVLRARNPALATASDSRVRLVRIGHLSRTLRRFALRLGRLLRERHPSVPAVR